MTNHECDEMVDAGGARAAMAREAVHWAISNDLVPYEAAMRAMAERAAAIRARQARELVWLLEHPPIYTAGTGTQPEDLLDAGLFPVIEAGRGGRLTYHGPGQRVAYLMLDLRQRGTDIRALIANIERWVIGALARFNVRGEMRPGRVGVWVRRPELGLGREDKIAAIGLRVSGGVTTHGISLNVEPDLSHYRGIVPCGIGDHGVTSLADLGLPVAMVDADVALRQSFEETFAPVIRCEPPLLSDPLS